MAAYIVQHFYGGKWCILSPVQAHEDREIVLERFEHYLATRVGKSTKSASREYRLAKFHYKGCRHLVNPNAS